MLFSSGTVGKVIDPALPALLNVLEEGMAEELVDAPALVLVLDEGLLDEIVHQV